MRNRLKTVFPHPWLHYELNARQRQWVLILLSLAFSIFVFLVRMTTGTPFDLFLWGGSMIFMAIFCPPSLSSTQKVCGNWLDTVGDGTWFSIHILSNALFYSLILIIAIFLVRLVNQSEKDVEASTLLEGADKDE